MILIFFRLSEEYQMKWHRRKTQAIRGENNRIKLIHITWTKKELKERILSSLED